MKDNYGRDIDYMRVSITDRCDLRCKYCMPDGCEKVPMERILTFEEIVRIIDVSSKLGIRKIKITGGEPFVRRGCMDLMRQIKDLAGIEQVTVTTNGQTLDRYIDELKAIGIDGINISLDTLDPERFSYITGGGELAKTMRAIDLAAASGIRTKVNCVLEKGFNEDEITDLASLAFRYGIDVRFIEMMPIGVAGTENGVSNETVLEELKKTWPDLVPDESVHGNGPAVYYKRPGAGGGIGFISAINGVFCSDCNRVRLTSLGQLKPCLCYEAGLDLRPYLDGSSSGGAGGESDSELKNAIRRAILSKPEAHCFNGGRADRGAADSDSIEQRLMAQIGG